MRRDDPEVFQVTGLDQLFDSHLFDSKNSEFQRPEQIRKLIDVLKPHVTKQRFQKMQHVVKHRTHQVTLVLEGLTDPHNVSAILRSADAFGIQNVNVIDGPSGFGASRGVTKGAHKWIDVFKHETPKACAQKLHDQGYKILIAKMDGQLQPQDLAKESKIALVFGNEHAGVSADFEKLADESYAIPMKGFVESLNVSVAAAITLFSATRRDDLLMNPDGQNELLARYLLKSIKNVRTILSQRFLR